MEDNGMKVLVVPIKLKASGPIPSVLWGGPCDGFKTKLAVDEWDVLLRGKGSRPLVYRWFGEALTREVVTEGRHEIQATDLPGRPAREWPREWVRVFRFSQEAGDAIERMEEGERGAERFAMWMQSQRAVKWRGGRNFGDPVEWEPWLRSTREGA